MMELSKVLAQLRAIVSSDTWPLGINEWTYMRDTNCLAFALGLHYPDPWYHALYGHLFSITESREKFQTTSISKSVIRDVIIGTCDAVGLECRTLEIVNDAKPDEYVIGFFGPYSTAQPGCGYNDVHYQHDFHVVRRNLDGTWVHKPSWEVPPEEFKWKSLSLIYPERPANFAIRRKTRS